MTPRRSNSYAELEQTLREFEPDQRITTRMVINGPEQRAAAGLDMPSDVILGELDKLAFVAALFNTNVSTAYDADSNSAFVGFAGPAADVANLAAFMAAAESVVSAR
jgi:hypothetical protein